MIEYRKCEYCGSEGDCGCITRDARRYRAVRWGLRVHGGVFGSSPEECIRRMKYASSESYADVIADRLADMMEAGGE